MEQFFEFIANNLLLFIGFCVALIAVIGYEARRATTGVRALEPGAATQLYNRDEAVFVDARGDQQYRRGHLPGAVHLPQNYSDDQLKRLKRERTLVVYDDNGTQAGKLAKRLQGEGYAAVYQLRGGFNAWREAGYPVHK